MSYDPECYSLACYFLDDTNATQKQREHLAQCIQDRIEDELSDLARQLEEQASDGRWEK